MKVEAASADELASPSRLLEAELREGEPLPEDFAAALAEEVRSGVTEVLAAREPGSEEIAGVALVCYRLNLASGGRFASFEELHVAPEYRNRGVGRALLAEVERRCRERRISYIEAQIIEESVDFFLAAGYEEESDLRVLSRSVAFNDQPPAISSEC